MDKEAKEVLNLDLLTIKRSLLEEFVERHLTVKDVMLHRALFIAGQSKNVSEKTLNLMVKPTEVLQEIGLLANYVFQLKRTWLFLMLSFKATF